MLKSNKSLKQEMGLHGIQSPKSNTGLLRQKSTTLTMLRPKKPKLPTISKLKKEADKWHSLATRYRFADLRNGVWWASCFTCGLTKPIKELQCGHFMSRAANETRFDERNTAPQCYGCNVMQQGRQYVFGTEIDNMYGEGTAKELYKLSKVPHQFKRDELLEIIHDAKEQVAFYEKQL